MAAIAFPEGSFFAVEEATYSRHRSSLLMQATGQYALIKGEMLMGTYSTELEALEHGTQVFADQPFYIRQICETEEPVLLPSPLAEMH